MASTPSQPVPTATATTPPGVGRPRPTGGTPSLVPATKLMSLSTLRRGDDALLRRGPRRGELGGLKWSAIDLDRGTFRVVETRIVVGGRAKPSSPKTDSGRRSVPLDPHLVALLKAHRKTQREERLRAGAAWVDSGHVFTNELGEPLNPDWISRRFVELAKAARLPPLTVHGCRHTAASIMLSSGIDPATAAAILGHSSPVITMSVYRHLFEGETARAGALMSRVLRGETYLESDPLTNG